MTAGLDLDRLRGYLKDLLPGFDGPIEAVKFDIGQSNPTYRIDTRAGVYVLRRKPPGVLLKSAHAVEREFRVQQALAGTAVPVAKMRLLCQDAAVIGSAFYVMDFIEGTVYEDPRLESLAVDARGAVYDEMNRVLCAIHSVDLEQAGLGDYGPEGNYYSRQIERWTQQYRASQTGDLSEMDALIDWLAENQPADDGRRVLVHGDYRIDNLLFAVDRPRCLAVLDWELSTTGHPFADLAAVVMQWQMPPGRMGRGLAGLDRAALGLPGDQDFVDQYCDRMNLPGIPRFGFYLAFCFFRMGAILQGVKKRALEGNASNPEQALKLGEFVPLFAKQGLQAARQD